MNSKKLLIGFYAHGLPFHGDTLMESSLGGSETALLYMARELAKRGHDVKVFNNCPKPGRYDGVDYYNFKTQWRDIAPVAEWDVFIVSRDFTFCAQKMNARLVGLWNHDVATDRQALMTNVWGIDWTWCLSDFHVGQYLNIAKELEPVMYKTRNGVDMSLINACSKNAEGEVIPRDKKYFVWGSRPERGLDILLQHVWPRILKDVDPEARLLIAGYSDKGIEIPEHVKQYHQFIDQLIKEATNVQHIGHLKKDEWYRVLHSSGMMLYPTKFPEISCIAAMEAQACGLPIVTSDEFALKETVKDKNNRIPHHPESEEYLNKFIARVRRLYTNDFEYKQSQRIGREHVQGHYEWSKIAEEWEDFFWERFRERSLKNGGRNSVRNLIHNSDLLGAKWALDNNDITGIDVSECEEEKKEIHHFLNKHHDDPELYDVHDEDEEKPEKFNFENIGRFNAAVGHIKHHFKDKPFSVVDVGCGSGRFLAKVLKEFPDQASVQGLDFSSKLIERASKNILHFFPDIGDPKNFMVTADFMKMDLPSEKSDCIFAGEWLEHQQDIYGALKNLEAWVKPGGFAVITVPRGAWEALSFKKSPEDRFHVSHFEFRDIEELFRDKKFSMEFFPAGISPIDASILGNWIVSWEVDHKDFGEINYLRKFRTARPYQYVSACMIVKNEEDYLSKCLKSIQNVVDEINIIDTGSTDSTIEIAKRYTNKIKIIKWPEDFSEARNVSIDLANPHADWIYWMDADEELMGAERMRRYLGSELYNGYVITQNHLTIDMPNVKPDVPVRLYKNHKGIKFFGSIHEHCEMALDKPIDPVLILQDVKILHYGYMTEGIRRWKCKERNLELLKKDREKYPNRLLGIVLMMRDYLNISQWDIEESRGVMTDRIIKYLREVVRLHRQYFMKEDHIYHTMSFSLYQRALASLGKQLVSISESNSKTIPFEIKFAMGGSVGGTVDPDKIGIDAVWFGDRQEFEAFMKRRTDSLGDGLNLQ